MSDTGRGIIGIVKRNWWIVALAAVAGGVVAYLVTGAGPERFEATAPIAIDNATVATQPRVPKPDGVIAMVQRPEFAEEIDLPEGATLRAYATGNPQDRLFVAVIADDEESAERAAKAAGEQAVVAVRTSMDEVLSDQRALIAANETALERLGEPAEGDELASFLRWDIEKDNLNEKSLLEFLENAYSFQGDVTVAPAAATRSAAVSGAGGALAGLFLGLALAAVRELAARRAA